LLDTVLADNVKARVLQRDGAYHPVRPRRRERAVRSQMEFTRLAEEGATPKLSSAPPKPRVPAMKVRTRP
jgi:polyphosphate kinase